MKSDPIKAKPPVWKYPAKPLPKMPDKLDLSEVIAEEKARDAAKGYPAPKWGKPPAPAKA